MSILNCRAVVFGEFLASTQIAPWDCITTASKSQVWRVGSSKDFAVVDVLVFAGMTMLLMEEELHQEEMAVVLYWKTGRSSTTFLLQRH